MLHRNVSSFITKIFIVAVIAVVVIVVVDVVVFCIVAIIIVIVEFFINQTHLCTAAVLVLVKSLRAINLTVNALIGSNFVSCSQAKLS